METLNTQVDFLGCENAQEFKDVRIYGTYEEPLFLAQDVMDALQVKHRTYKDSDLFIEGWDKVKMNVKIPSGTRSMWLLTTSGLTMMMYASKSPIARNFRIYVNAVLQRLRIHGSVNLKEAKEDYDRRLGEFHSHIKALEDEKRRLAELVAAREQQLDEEHAKVVVLKERDELITNKLEDVRYNNAILKDELENAITRDEDFYRKQYERLKQKYMRPVWICAVKPPRDADLAEHPDFEDFDIEAAVNEETDWIPCRISFTKPVGRDMVPVKQIYVHARMKVEEIESVLAEYRVTKKDGTKYKDVFECTVEMIERDVQDAMWLP